ncbi:MAG: twin-arginine translocase TatA/TatE family subunit [bacterium]|nr:twin-arginine translocase TatA/TatE family subunit [bacterium]
MGFLSNIGTTELIIIALVLLFLFGGKKLTELARGAGETGRELKKVKREFQATLNETPDEKAPESKKGGK